MVFCNNCGKAVLEGAKFCSYCGKPIEIAGTESDSVHRESIFYRGNGTLVVKKTNTKSAAKKAANLLSLGSNGQAGYVLFSSDKNMKTNASGELIVTNRAIYCAGKDFPFDRLVSMTRRGKKAVGLTLERSFTQVGQTDKMLFGMGGLSIEAEIRVDSRDACDELFGGLQKAKTSHLVSGPPEPA